VVAWRQLAAQGLFLATSPRQAFFYVFTALHGVHSVGGARGVAVRAANRLRRTAWRRAKPRSARQALYWHFMGVLWLYLLTILAIGCSRPEGEARVNLP